ncbi:MAG TPA: hypothetical protein PLM29_10620 [Deltaproteobacteria bacterium]|nr:hypothetical protein [Deltaproteobacteria bacterium]
MSEEIFSTIRTIEGEAEALLSQARTKARDILEDAKKQSRLINAEEFQADETQQQREKIVHEAKKKAEDLIEEARGETVRIKKQFDSNADEVVEMILKHIYGNA